MDAKERIANKHGIMGGFTIHSNPDLAKKALYECMEEYHQSKLPTVEEMSKVIRDELMFVPYEACDRTAQAIHDFYHKPNNK